MSFLKGWKTVVFGALVTTTSVLSTPEVQGFVAQHFEAVGGALGGVIIGLRWLSSSPIFNKSR